MDSYSIFENYEEERSDKEESFIDETKLDKVEIISSSTEDAESEEQKTNTVDSTANEISENDPLGIAGMKNSQQETNRAHTNTINQPLMKFDLPEHSSIIKVIGVGGGGSNAVNHM